MKPEKKTNINNNKYPGLSVEMQLPKAIKKRQNLLRLFNPLIRIKQGQF